MRWGSLETFLVESDFWQEKMGKPVANREFLKSLLRHGTFDHYRFFCADRHHLARFRAELERMLSPEDLKRVGISLQATFEEELKAHPLDIVHQGDFTYFMPHLVEFRNGLAPENRFPVSGVTHSLDGAWMQTRLMQLLLARPSPEDAIFCTSTAARVFLERAFEEVSEAFRERFGVPLAECPELVQIPLAIPDEFHEKRDRMECRARLGLAPDELIVLSLGRFSVRHKTDLAPLLECVEWLRHCGALPRFRLVLAGSGRPDDLSLVAAMIRHLRLGDVVRVEPNIETSRKLLLYGAADIFVSIVDNFQETLGLTILEAMAHGLPVVASDFSGYRDLVTHGRTGFLIPTRVSPSFEPWESAMGFLDPSVARLYTAQKVTVDLADLAGALTALGRNPVLRTSMSLRARANASTYRWPWIIQLYEDVWRRQAKAMAGKRSSGETAPHGRPFLVPRYSRIFGHFPSSRTGTDARFTLGEYGRSRVEQGFEPILYEELKVLLEPALREGILAILANGVESVESLMQKLTDGWSRGALGTSIRTGVPPSSGAPTGPTREAVILQLDWLDKHGYLRFVPPSSP